MSDRSDLLRLLAIRQRLRQGYTAPELLRAVDRAYPRRDRPYPGESGAEWAARTGRRNG